MPVKKALVLLQNMVQQFLWICCVVGLYILRFILVNCICFGDFDLFCLSQKRFLVDRNFMGLMHVNGEEIERDMDIM